MKVTGLALVPPPTAADLPKVTPELLASVLARYSRSNEGLASILTKVDVNNPEASIDRILKFVDYGHASIGGLTGGLAIALDGVSMWLAWKIFEIATMADGQESSTRYITMDAANLPSPAEIGIPADLATRWTDVMAAAFAAYHAEYMRLDLLATAKPELVRLPPDAKPGRSRPHPGGTDQAVAPAHAAQHRGKILRGTGAPGTRREPQARPRAALRAAAR